MRAFKTLAVALATVAILAPAAATAQDEEAAVLQALHAFHDALEAGDGDAALALLGPAVRILEGGGVETKDHYASGHLDGDMAFAQAVPADRGPATVRIMGDVAWVVSTSTRAGEYNGREISSRGAELAVLTRIDGEWKISAVSWSSGR